MRFSGTGKLARYGLASAMLAVAAGLAVATSPLRPDADPPAPEPHNLIAVRVDEMPAVGGPPTRPGELPRSDARIRAPRAVPAARP